MKRKFILIWDPENMNSIIGVFDSGKQLADAAVTLAPKHQADCLVKIAPANQLSPTVAAGFDHQGTRLNEFLHTPASRDDTGN